MLKPSDLTKAELLQVVEMLAMETGPYYFDLLRPYEGKPIGDVPSDVLEQATAELDKARAAGQEWNRRNGIKLKGRVSDEKMHR